MKSCPICNQTYADDYQFCPKDASPLVVSEKQESEWVADDFKPFKLQGSRRVDNNLAVIDDPAVSFNITRNYESARDADELYEITRGFWKVFRNRSDKAKYAFAVFKGEIKEVYEIDRWEEGGRELSEFWLKRKREQGEDTDPSVNKGRFQFVGQVAPEVVRTKYVGKQLPPTTEKFPVRYFNC